MDKDMEKVEELSELLVQAKNSLEHYRNLVVHIERELEEELSK